jgi:hypothetical protein
LRDPETPEPPLRPSAPQLAQTAPSTGFGVPIVTVDDNNPSSGDIFTQNA